MSILPVIDDEGFLNIYKYRDGQLPELLTKTQFRPVQVHSGCLFVIILQEDGTVIQIEQGSQDRTSQVIEYRIRFISQSCHSSTTYLLSSEGEVMQQWGVSDATSIGNCPEIPTDLRGDIIVCPRHLYRIPPSAVGNPKPIDYPVPGREAETQILCGLVAVLDDDLYILVEGYHPDLGASNRYVKFNLSEMGAISKADVWMIIPQYTVTLLTHRHELYTLTLSRQARAGIIYGDPEVELIASDIADFGRIMGSSSRVLIMVDLEGSARVEGQEPFASGIARLSGRPPLQDRSWIRKRAINSKLD